MATGKFIQVFVCSMYAWLADAKILLKQLGANYANDSHCFHGPCVRIYYYVFKLYLILYVSM